MSGLIAGVAGVASVVAWIFILIHAFQNEWWKGLLCILCPLYLIYYMFVEFEHTSKWQIVITYWVGSFLSGFFGRGILHH